MTEIRVWFYNPCSDSSGWVNKLVSRLDPPYCHCELQFADDVSCSIYMGSNVLMKRRTFDDTCYDCVRLPCTVLQHSAMYAAASAFTQAQVQFSTAKMTGCLTWLPTSSDSSSTFCSKLCADIMQGVSILAPGVETGKTSPSQLHRLLQCKLQLDAPPPAVRGIAIDFRT